MYSSLDVLNAGYCTNVHAGTTIHEVIENLRTHALVARRIRNRPIGIGLWFSETSLAELNGDESIDRFRSQLDEFELIPYTLNGFPQGNFHQHIVKHDVYLPAWWEPSRLAYTQQLVRVLDRLLPPQHCGSISTLPIAWGQPPPSTEQLDRACRQLITLAQDLAELHFRSDRYVVLAIEPEPGCLLTDSNSFRVFYLNELLPRCRSERQRNDVTNHITLCHDICHAAVMFEDQAAELHATIQAGIKIGKVQVSSAISVPWHRMDEERKKKAREQLSKFAEDRYLHQTCIDDGQKLRLSEDLPIAIREQQIIGNHDREWRVHFHVPIYLEHLGELASTRFEILKCLGILKPLLGNDSFPTRHFEVETYAWTVLPKELQAADLAQGIAREIEWFADAFTHATI